MTDHPNGIYETIGPFEPEQFAVFWAAKDYANVTRILINFSLYWGIELEWLDEKVDLLLKLDDPKMNYTAVMVIGYMAMNYKEEGFDYAYYRKQLYMLKEKGLYIGDALSDLNHNDPSR